ncbi:MAG: RluA family pseudouridine synthase [Thermodesulfobacteriota bacterium]
MQQNHPDDFILTADSRHKDMRLDQFISEESICSRSLAASLVKKGVIRVNDQTAKPSHKIKPGDKVTGHVSDDSSHQMEPESIPLEVIHEDQHLIIINKPPGLVVHPAPGHFTGTLVNGLLSRYPEIRFIGDESRPGIVHRLDRDTSGALIVARSEDSFEKLTAMFASRAIDKKYLAIIYGSPENERGSIRLPIGRHVSDRKKMSVHSSKTRQAETDWHVLKRFGDASLLEITIKTGRTHQIRVHCAAAGTPVVGDDTYKARWTRQPAHFKDRAVFDFLSQAPRQMLHAWKLEFTHPDTGERVRFTAPVATDMRQLLKDLNRSG